MPPTKNIIKQNNFIITQDLFIKFQHYSIGAI